MLTIARSIEDRLAEYHGMPVWVRARSPGRDTAPVWRCLTAWGWTAAGRMPPHVETGKSGLGTVGRIGNRFGVTRQHPKFHQVAGKSILGHDDAGRRDDSFSFFPIPPLKPHNGGCLTTPVSPSWLQTANHGNEGCCAEERGLKQFCETGGGDFQMVEKVEAAKYCQRVRT